MDGSLPGTAHDIADFLPSIKFHSGSVLCDGHDVLQGAKPLAKRLFSAFEDDHGRLLSAEELAEFVYGDEDLLEKSDRYRLSKRQALVKLISRTRLDAERALSNVAEQRLIDWFWYEPSVRQWGFYRPTTHYFVHKRRLLHGQAKDVH